MHSFRSGAAAMLVEKLVKMACQLGTLILLARYLGPEDLGSIMYCYALASLFVFLNNFGLSTLFLKWLTEDSENSLTYFKNALLIRAIAALSSVMIINILGLWLINEDARVLLFAISLYHLLLPISLIEWYFQAQGRATLSAYALITGSIAGFIIRLTILLLSADIFWLGAAYSLELIVTALAFFYIWQKESFTQQSKISFAKITEMSQAAFPLLLSGAVIMLYMRIDQLMIGYIIGDHEVGIYSAAVRLSEAWYFVGLTILGVYFPKFLNTRKEFNDDRYFESIIQIGRIVFWGAIFLSIITSLLSNWLINFFYGNDFTGASSVLITSIWAVGFVYLGTISSQMLIADEKQSLQLYRSCGALLINIILNFLLIPNYGANGAAIALLVAQIYSGILFNIIFKMDSILNVQKAIFLPLSKTGN